MKIKDFKEFLKLALTRGYYPIMNYHGFRNLKPSQIEEIVDTLPEWYLSEDDKNYKEYLEYYKVVLEDLEDYKLHYKLINTALKKYGEHLQSNYNYAINNINDDNKNDKNVYKTEDICYNIEYKEKDLTKCKLDIKKIKTAMKLVEMSHEELSDILKISVRSVDRKLNNETEFKAIELIKVMKIFGLEIDDILKEEN